MLLGCCLYIASNQMKATFFKATGLKQTAGAIVSGTSDQIRNFGFDFISEPTSKFPGHARIVHPHGVDGFNDENLQHFLTHLKFKHHVPSGNEF